MKTDQPLSVAEALELPEGTDDQPTWINSGVTGVVAEISPKETKTGKKYWNVTLRSTTGSATIGFTLWTAPKFNPGDVIDVTGKGISRTAYNGRAELKLGKSVEVHKLGRGIPPQAQAGEVPADVPQAGTPEAATPVAGQTVGMAIKEALLLRGPIVDSAQLESPEFWRGVHATASDIIRLSRQLERGILAPSVKVRAGKGAPPADKPAEPPPPPPPREPAPAVEEDVPF